MNYIQKRPLLIGGLPLLRGVRMDNQEQSNTKGRRGFLRLLGASSAGIAFVAAAQAIKDKSNEGIEVTRAEVDKLKEDYERLDRKIQFILKIVLALSGLDIFLSL